MAPIFNYVTKTVMPCCDMEGQSQVSLDQWCKNSKIPGSRRVARIKSRT